MITQFKNDSYRWSVAGIGIITVLAAISVIDPTRGAVSASPAPQDKATVTMRLVQKEIQDHVSMSPDGRYLCGCGTFAEREGITIRELATGTQRVIKPTRRTPAETGPQDPIMSPDGKTIAYTVGRPKEGADGLFEVDVCLIGADGSGQRVVYPGVVRSVKEATGSERPLPYPGAVRPIQWFPKGDRFLAIRCLDPMRAWTEIELVSVSASYGSVQSIKTLTGDFFRTTIRLSPDAKYVAYELASKDAPAKCDVLALEIDSQREMPLIKHPADDKLLGWAPDGRRILFISDRLGPWSAWLLPIDRGQAQGTPELVTRNIGEIRPVGFAENGSYYYRLRYGLGDVYTAAINVTTGQLLSEPSPLEVAGSAHGPDWSPDGRYLAYCSKTPTAAPSEPGVIRIRSLATGEEREIVPKIPTYFRRIRWSPDGRSLIASQLLAYKLGDAAWPMRVCRIDVETGDSTVLLDTKPNPSITSNVSLAELSPDGKILYYSGGPIVRRQLDTGDEKRIFTGSRGQALWALSPDGEFIATGRNEGTERKDAWEGGVKRVMLIPAQGGPANELVRWDEPAGVLTNFAWSRDSKTVLFVLHRDPVKGKNLKQIDELWQVSIDGGQPRKITETDSGVWYDLRVHPDGQRIAFWAALARTELWVMQNFLPAATGTKESQ